jgi:integrase/recombinase XerD
MGEQEALFLSKRGRRLSRNAVGEVIGKYAQSSGIQKHITPHTFRRSCATEMIKNHANIMHVKELLGHRSLRTVQIYCDLTIVELKKEHRLHHPRERG